MGKRKCISASLRWSVFARDGFSCRYCGSQAGQEGVELHADHVLSVNDGGDNSFDNLVTACQQCNGGKGARNLKEVPTSEQVLNRINEQTRSLHEQAEAIQASIKAQRLLEQMVVQVKCEAYGVKQAHFSPGEIQGAINLIREFGPERVFEWYNIASGHGVSEYRSIKYICGIARNVREQQAA